MSSIDERVVRMEFDNKKFEAGVSTTMSTLEKLNEALRLRQATAGFEDVQKASASLDFSPLNDSLWQVQQNFSFFGEFVRTVFDRISNRIIDLGTTMVRELTTAPLRAGFGEYELQMGSTQTIMASTGATIEEVTRYLDELNTYADRTIYSFSDMTANIGKFTNAGVPLEKAVKAIQGISNEAAVSGANAQEASRAMYNFAQALSAGYVKLIDWKSIENANMATVEFKNQLLETAAQMGTLEKTADGMYRVLTKNGQGGTLGELIDATHLFNDSLAYQWMTSEVLTTTLGRYADETTEIGKKAFAAATEVKTFNQLIDTVKESLGSGWTKSFSYIIGNLEEAKVLWTGVNNEINSILDPIANAREAMLKFWHDNGGRDAAIKAITDAWQGLKAIMSSVSGAFEQVFPPITGKKLVSITESIAKMAERFREFATSSHTLGNVARITRGLANALKFLTRIGKGIIRWLSPLLGIFKEFGGALFEAATDFSDFITTMTHSRGKIYFIERAFADLRNGARHIVEGLEQMVKSLFGLLNIDLKGNPLTTLYDKTTDFLSNIFGSSGVDILTRVSTAFENFGSRVSTALGDISSGIKPKLEVGFSIVGDVVQKLGEKVSEWAPKIVEYLGSDEFRDVLKNTDLLAGGGLLLSLTGLSTSLRDFVNSKSDVAKQKGFLGVITDLLGDLIQPFVDVAEKTVDTFTDFLDQIKDHLAAFQDAISPGKIALIALSLGIMAGAINTLSKIDPISAGHAMGALVVSLLVLVGGLALMMNSFDLKSISTKLPILLVGISLAMGLMAKSVKELSSLNWDQLAKGLFGVEALMFGFAGVVRIMNDMRINFRTMIALIALAAALRIIDDVVVTLSGIDVIDLTKSLFAVTALLFEFAIATRVMSYLKVKPGVMLALLALVGAIKILEGVMQTFHDMDAEHLVYSLAAVSVLVIGLAHAVKTLGYTKINLRTVMAVVAIAGALKILEGSVVAFSNINYDKLAYSLLTIAGLLIGVCTALYALSGFSVPVTTILAIGVLSVAVVALAETIKSFSESFNEKYVFGMIAFVFVLGTLTASLMVLGSGSPLMLAGAAALLVVAGALTLFLPILQSFMQISLDFATIAKAVGAIVLAMAGLAIGMAVIGVVSPLVVLFAISVAALAAAVTSLGVALTGLPVGMAALAGAVAIIADSAKTLSTVMSTLVEGVFIGLIKGLIAIPVELIKGIKPLLEALSVALKAIVDFLVESAPVLVEGIGMIIVVVLDAVAQITPKLADVVGKVIYALLVVLVAWLPTIAGVLVQGVVVLVNSIANGIRDNTEGILAAVRNILSSIIELILTALADILRLIPGVGDVLADTLEGARDNVREWLAPESFESATNDAMASAALGAENGGSELVTAFGEAGGLANAEFFEQLGSTEGVSEEFVGPLLQDLESHEGDFAEPGSGSGENWMNGFTSAIGGDASSEAWQGVLSDMQGYGEAFTSQGMSDGQSYMDGFSSVSGDAAMDELIGTMLDNASEYSSMFSDVATEHGAAYTDTLGGVDASASGETLSSSGAEGAGSKRAAYIASGEYMASGFNWSICSPYALEQARRAGALLTNTVLGSIRATASIASPSKKTKKLGSYVSEGFAIGISSLSGLVYKESSNVGQNAIDGIRNSLGEVSKYLDEDLDFDPTIRPVMDLSEIQNGVNSMNRIMGDGVTDPLVGVSFGAYPQRLMSGMLGNSPASFGSRAGTVENNTYYNLYMDGVLVNDDEGINSRFIDLMYELKLKERGYIG